ncbi:MAG: cation:proton antiporter regulatory subunit [Vallitaleaceae bacterium]|nr:cation:proton antiporter regulatory subunit [Vallitaleaceae bacterium]
MAFYSEANVPGIGKKINCTTHAKDNFSIIIHHDGKRELYIMDQQGDSQASITLLDEESRQLGTFLSGAMYTPKVIENLVVSLEGIKVNWYKLSDNSPIIGRTLGGLGIRKKSHISIIAVVNGDDFITNPNSDYVFRTGDTCVVIGKPERFGDFLKIISEA